MTSLMVLLGTESSPDPTQLLWIAEKTTRSPGTIPEAVRDRVHAMSEVGSSRLAVYAVGSRAERVALVDLEFNQDGDPVQDRILRAREISRRMAVVDKAIATTSVGEKGFSLYEALRVSADEADRTGMPVEAWLSTTVFTGTAEPLSIAELTGADPSRAVDELMAGSIQDLDLGMVDLHLVTLTPVGDGQEPLTPRSESWRNKFLVELAERLGATVDEPLHDASTKRPWPNSSMVVPIVPLSDPPPQPAPTTPPADAPLIPPRIDNAWFEPDTAELTDPAAARRAVQQVIDTYLIDPAGYTIYITGYCARYGAREGALRTSLDRANAVAALLRAAGVDERDIDVRGVGYDELADVTKGPRDPAQRVVVIDLVPRS